MNNMLQQMMDIQNSVSESLGISHDLDSLHEAVVGMNREVNDVAEGVEDAMLEPKVLEGVNLGKADTAAISALTYILEYFALREWTAEDIETAYLMLIGEIVNQVQETEEAGEAFFEMLKSVLAGDLADFIEAFNTMEADVEAMNCMNGLELKDASTGPWTEEEASEYVEKMTREALGDDCPGYIAGGGN